MYSLFEITFETFNSLRGGVAFGSDRDRKPSRGSGGGGSRHRKGSVSRKHSS